MSACFHQPVLVEEVLAGLRPRSAGLYVDATLGGGGHAEAILGASAPDGRLRGCDRDPVAIAAARERLSGFGRRVEIRLANHADLGDWLADASCDGVLFDLGVSSAQLAAAERGFSFQLDGPLDMRADPRQATTAADWVNRASVAELHRILARFGEEPEALKLARAIDRERERGRIESTRQLAALVTRVKRFRRGRVHPATRVFLALRMAVNDELGCLRRGLEAAVGLLRPGGRLAVISFHSVEDRCVKEFGREQTRGYTVPGPVDVPELRQPCRPTLVAVTSKAIRPGAAETAANPRARSAQLRVWERV